MCGIVGGTCSAVIIVLVVINIGLSIGILVVVVDDNSEIEAALQWVNGNFNIEQLEEFFDFSHYPSKPSEFFDRPMLGNCCDNMCSGTRCFTGTAFLMRDDHCNNCCFHLITPGSSTDYTATCYANDQSEDRRRINSYIDRVAANISKINN